MLKQSLQSINNILDNLITITSADIEDIKQANHEVLFQRNNHKEELIAKFTKAKSEIDSILVKRSQSGKDLKDLISPDEDILLGEFREKLQTFYRLHKKFAKMAFMITHFYNNLLHKINGSEVDIGYQMNPPTKIPSNFSLKA